MNEKTAKHRRILENNGIKEGYIGIDRKGNTRFVIKHTRLNKGNSTVLVELYKEGDTLIGGGKMMHIPMVHY